MFTKDRGLGYLFIYNLVTPGNPQRYNLMIAKQSLRLYFYMSLFTLGVTALVNTVFENCLKKSVHVTKLEVI